MGIAGWFGDEGKDLERGEELGEGDQDGEVQKRGRLDRGESTETKITQLSCVENDPENPLDRGLFTVTPWKKEDTDIEGGKLGKLNTKDDPLDLKKPYSVSSRQLEGEGMRVARGESAFLSKSEVMWVNVKVWLTEHVLGYVVTLKVP